MESRMRYVLTNGDFQSWGPIMFVQVSTCTGFAAMTQANMKYSKGYTASGVGAVICARHEFFLANGVGDTQVGEK